MNYSTLGLGCAQLGFKYGITNQKGKLSYSEAIKILDKASALGITTFDTAPAYGDSEEIVGSFLKAKKNSEKNFQVVTKISNLEVTLGKNSSKMEIISFIEKSLKRSIERLGKENISNILFHGPNDYELFPEALTFSVENIFKEHNIENVGISVYDQSQVESIINQDLFNSIQIPFSILDLRMYENDIIRRLRTSNFYIFTRSTFLQGIVFKKPNQLPPFFNDLKPFLEKLQGFSNKYNLSIQQLTMNFVKSFKFDSTFIGAETPEQIENNHMGWDTVPLSDNQLSELTSSFKSIPDKMIDPRLWNQDLIFG